MDINNFSQTILEGVCKELGPEYAVSIVEVPKNNGIILRGLNILNRQVNISPCIYLDGYFEKYTHGETGMDDVVDDIIRTYREYAPKNGWDTDRFTDYDRAKENLYGRLVNTEKNAELLKNVPHRDFLDLSLIYSVDIACDESDRIGSIMVTNDHAKMWNVDEEQLFRQAEANMERPDEIRLEDLAETVEKITGESLPFPDGDQIPMYILTNRHKVNGAAVMMSSKALQMASRILGQDFVIIPSSVHETLIIPVSEVTEDMGAIAEMVQKVNDTQLSLNEILSYHVYRYDHETGSVSIAA
jgi:hypothetical protein